MQSSSETIPDANTQSVIAQPSTVTGDKYKGDGYYGSADGVHTVQYNFTDSNRYNYNTGTLGCNILLIVRLVCSA